VDLNVDLNMDLNAELSDSVLRHLREVVDLPDLTGTRYQLIGRGGLGAVYAAHDTQLDRRVAIKVMDAAWAGEARLIARLEHPGIVPVYDAGTLPDGRVFYAMKLVAGARADRYVAGNPSLGERLCVAERVGEALAYAHSCGVLQSRSQAAERDGGPLRRGLRDGLGCRRGGGDTGLSRPGNAARPTLSGWFARAR
jgi:hypothetical protein